MFAFTAQAHAKRPSGEGCRSVYSIYRSFKRFICVQDADQTVNTFFDLFAYRIRNSLIQHAMFTTTYFSLA